MSSMSYEKLIRYQTFSPLPKKTIEMIIRSTLPKRVKISDEFKNAVNRCAQIYVLSVAAAAQKHYKTSHITEDMVIQINGLMGFEEFVEPLEQFREELIESKSKPLKSKKTDVKVETTVETGECGGQQSSDPNSQGSNAEESIDVEDISRIHQCLIA